MHIHMLLPQMIPCWVEMEEDTQQCPLKNGDCLYRQAYQLVCVCVGIRRTYTLCVGTAGVRKYTGGVGGRVIHVRLSVCVTLLQSAAEVASSLLREEQGINTTTRVGGSIPMWL
ncbi:hypothetical protein Q5P01_008560 [Channa striata]|uniref:Uncharacterized protein n=1 Tax=Channa striata TaxID=64152 RepID=A0AA88N3M2_CHASR|nr:hypothetical protein Q5P01_008560 [Channa striata]